MIALLIYVTLVLVTLTILALFLYQNYSKFFYHINKIPCEPKLPLLGHAFHIAFCSGESLFVLDRNYAKTYYPIYCQSVLHYVVISIFSPEDVEVALTHPNLTDKNLMYLLIECWLGTGLLTSNGEKWKKRRKLLTGTFHFNILQEFLHVFNESTSHFIENLVNIIAASGNCVEITKPIKECTLEAIAETSMGIKLDKSQSACKEYRAALIAIYKLLRHRMTRPWFYKNFTYFFSPSKWKSKKVCKTLHQFSEYIINERKNIRKMKDLSYSAKKKVAMLDLLLNAQESGEDIDDVGIREEVDTFMFEGHDTTSIALIFIFLLLANDKKIQDDVRQEIIDTLGDGNTAPTYSQLQELPLTERCLKECLRLYPSVPIIGRNATADIQLPSGYVLPKGAMVHVNIIDLHRNENVWPQPEKFDPDRFLPENIKNRHPFAYLPFSAGARNCIGQKFALLELKAVLCGVLREFYLEPLQRPEDVVFAKEIVLHSHKDIYVKFVKRIY